MLPGRFINADVIARTINPTRPEKATIAAGKRVLHDLRHAIATRADFIYETTLSSRQSLDLMIDARDAGYEVGLAFVALRAATLNVERVAQRVEKGGHDIPETVIRRRYETSLRNLTIAIGLAHGVVIYDNSDLGGPRLIVQIAAGQLEVSDLDAAEPYHRRIASSVAIAIGTDIEEILRRRGAPMA